MQHCDCGEKVSLYLDGLLEPEQTKHMEEHLAQCETCRVQWEAMRLCTFLLKAEPPVSPAVGFTHRVISRLQQRETRRQRLRSSARVLIGTAGLGSVLVVGFGGLFSLLWQPLLRVLLSDVILPLMSRTVSLLYVLGRALNSVVRDLSMRPTWLLLPAYAIVALSLVTLWTCVVVRPQTRGLRLDS